MKSLIITLTMITMKKNPILTINIAMIMLITKMSFNNTSWINYTMVYDTLSFWVMMLSLWITMMTSMIKSNDLQTQNKINTTLLATLITVFSVWNLMKFFIMFEILMMIMVIMVMLWGYQPERLEATLFMMFMTLMFSLPFIMTMMKNSLNLSFWFMKINMKMWDYLMLMAIFVVKMPVYFIHMWLPKIHVEAPVQGSMILAAIMLKLGCYGMIRILPATIKMTTMWMASIVAFSTWTIILMSLVSAMQHDLKTMIAYSSIVHMTITFMSIMMMKNKSMFASLLMMIGHGLCSSVMFFVCNTMYKNSKSRSMIMNKGILMSSPASMFIWFSACMSNAPMPPSINMFAELLTFKTTINWMLEITPMMMMIMFTSSYFSIVMFYTPAHGKSSTNSKKKMTTSAKELIISWLHIMPLILMTLKLSMMDI